MPSLYYRIDSPGVNILAPVAQQVVFGLLDELDLVDIFSNAVYILDGFSAYSQYDDGNGTPTLKKNRCDVEVSYVMDKSQVPWPSETVANTTAMGVRSDHKGMHTPILSDKGAGILIEHYTIPNAIEMRFTLNFQTYDDVAKAYDTIRARYAGNLVKLPFDVSFSYPVSMALYDYLLAVKQARTGYAQKSVLDYIKDKKVTEFSFDIRKSQLTSEDADKELMVRCQSIQNLGQLTMDQKEPTSLRTEELPDGFELEFQFVLQFGRPTMVAVHTPISVDNTVLPYSYFEKAMVNHHHNPDVSGVYDDLMVHEYLQRGVGNVNNTSMLFRLPVYDDWFTADNYYRHYEYRPFVVAHFTLDGPVTTIDLKQLDDVVLHPIVQSILKETRSQIFTYGGIFHIGVYANDLRLDEELVSLDENLILTIHSTRPDKQYHLILSETTALNKTNSQWDPILLRYRYFFPMSIERNLDHLVKKRFFFISYDDSLLSLIARLNSQGNLKSILTTMVALGEINNEIFAYTQSPVQLADYMIATQSWRTDYAIPREDPEDPESDEIEIVAQYYAHYASVESRSLFTAFIEQCLLADALTLDAIPDQYIRPNQTIYPYTDTGGTFYGFNTPLRILNYNIRTK